MPVHWINKAALHADLSGRTVIVVGTNVGIGLEAAKHFAKMNPKRLICTSRNAEKCAEVEEGTCVVCPRTRSRSALLILILSDPERDWVRGRRRMASGVVRLFVCQGLCR